MEWRDLPAKLFWGLKATPCPVHLGFLWAQKLTMEIVLKLTSLLVVIPH